MCDILTQSQMNPVNTIINFSETLIKNHVYKNECKSDSDIKKTIKENYDFLGTIKGQAKMMNLLSQSLIDL